MSDASYAPPLDQLLTLGEALAREWTWPDYLGLGITPEHVPALVRMSGDPALDRSDDPAALWAPVHAWRALGLLGDATAAPPLLDRLANADAEGDDGDEYAMAELPVVLGMLGPEALPALTAFLGRREVGPFARGGAAEAIAKVGKAHPTARDAAVAAVAGALAHHAVQDPAFNSILLVALLDLQAVEAVGVIERAFAADDLDPSFVGDWEDVQVALGLLDARLTPRPRYLPRPGLSLPALQADMRRLREHERQRAAHADGAASARKQRKSRQRQAAKSRRRNRGR